MAIVQMLTSVHFREVSSRRDHVMAGVRKRTSAVILSCCNEESIEVFGLQSGVGDDQQRPRLARSCSAKQCRNLYTVMHSLKMLWLWNS